MSVTIATRPIYPLVGQVVVSFTATLGDAVRVYVEAAPEGSDSAASVSKAGGPVLVHEGDADRAWRWDVDVPGRYIVRVDELDRDATAYAGGWRGSPERAVSETVVSSQSLAIVVGQPLTQPLGWGKNRGTLIAHLFGNYLRTLTIPIHGEVSPRLEKPSALMLTDDVQAAVVALGEQQSAIVLESIDTLCRNWAARFNAHVVSTSFHYAADSTNGLSASDADLTSTLGLGKWLAKAQAALKLHVQDYINTGTPSTTGFGLGGYHHATTTQGLPQAPAPTDAAGCLIALGDLLIAYDQHRVDTRAHQAADNNTVAGTPPALGRLVTVHYRVAKALRLTDSTLTDTEHSATPALVVNGGFAKL